MVHQHFKLVSTLTVTENIILGKEQRRFSLPRRQLSEQIRALGRKHGLEVDPEARVSTLSIGEQQRVEILKLLFRQAKILILDEPTAVLGPQETERLFETLRSLVSHGNTVLLITHKLDEVLAISDMVSVMRKGAHVGTLPTVSATREVLARMMVGREVLLRTGNPPQNAGRTILSIDRLGYRTPEGLRKLDALSLTVRAGEIYGIAGVEGNGQSELLSLLWGTANPEATTEGSITIDHTPVIGLSPAEIASLGVSMIPENRHKSAIITEYGIRENLLLGRHQEKTFHRLIGFDTVRITEYSRTLIERYDIRCAPDTNPPIGSLSGGNQQKVVLAREIERPALRLLILAQPTRGVDIGAIEQIHKRIIEARQSGLAILLISSEIEELTSLCTRIGCLYKGTIRHEFSESEIRKGGEEGAELVKQIGMHIT
jgi:simple sugar transport system ATP-binding protein